jgi:hypothetical protein
MLRLILYLHLEYMPLLSLMQVLESVKKTGRLIVIDESSPQCNIAGDVASVIGDISAFGIYAASKFDANGTGVSGAVTFLIGPSSVRISEKNRSLNCY